MTQAARTAFGEGYPLAEAYVQILATRGIEWGLIGPREADRLWDRHVLNSLAMVPFVPEAATVVDVGSGAGLPGIPLAIARPDLTVTLLEPLLRRFNFLVDAVDELGLGDRVTVVRGRAEEHKATYDVVTCRAVAPLERLVGWCAPLFLPSGELLAQKGSSAQAEVEAASAELRRRHLTARVVEAGGDTFIVRVRPTR